MKNFSKLLIQNALQTIDRIVYPKVCIGCGFDELIPQQIICYECIGKLPETNFYKIINNPIEKIFWGRIPIKQAGALYYFNKDSLIQNLLFELKYRNNKEVGLFFGRCIGLALKESTLYNHIDTLIPLPLHVDKEKMRGYNQAQLICDGIQTILDIPIYNKVVERTNFTNTQTKQNRIARWENMKDVFVCNNSQQLLNKNVLLVDDVITTGSTLEACGQVLINQGIGSLNIATLAYTIL